jgi:predicted nuclease of predicted toxin-antitoxin system
MKFIVDAQLPRSLAAFLRDKGFDVVHTSDLPQGNETLDAEINQLSLSEERILISKDGDFYDSFSAAKEPFKLLYVRTGNISNAKLIEMFEKNIGSILRQLEEGDVVEIDQHYLIALH